MVGRKIVALEKVIEFENFVAKFSKIIIVVMEGNQFSNMYKSYHLTTGLRELCSLRIYY